MGGVLYVPSSLLSVKVALASMSGSYPSCLSGEGLCHLQPLCPPSPPPLKTLQEEIDDDALCVVHVWRFLTQP